jgi:methylamine dehydrogenase accessory protein MauD
MTAALITIVILQWIATILLAILVLALLRQVGLLHERLGPVGALTLPGGPAVGSPPPFHELTALNGEIVKIGDPTARQATLLFFLSPGCPICKTMIPIITSIALQEGDNLRLVLASDGDEPAQRKMIAEHQLDAFPLILSTDLGRAYQVGKLPHAVLIDENNRIAAKGLVNNREHIESLFEARERGMGSLQEYRRKQFDRMTA